MALGLIFSNKIKRRFGIWAPALFFLAICLLCEVVCFNFEAIRSRTYSPVENYTVYSTATADSDGGYAFDSKSDYIEITDLDCVVKNIRVSTDNIYHQLKIIAIDDANSNWYTAGTAPISENAPSTQFIPTHFSGNVHSIRIYIPDINANENEVITLSDLSFNVQRGFFFSALRVILVLLILCFIYYLIILKDFWKITYNPKSNRQNILTVAVAVSLSVLFLIIPFTNSGFINPKWEHHNQYNELAQAFLHGSLSLEKEVPEALLNMENPYDRTQRAKVLSAAGIPSAEQPWDTAFYNGKYYVYFGVLPVLLFYLPFNALGISFPNFLGVVAFSWLLIAGVFLLYREFIKHYNRKVPYLLYLLLAISTLFSGGVIYMIKRPDFYSIPIMGALAFTVMGFYFWLKSKRDNSTLNPSHLMIGSFFMASVIALRPNLIFYSCGAFVIFFNSVFRDREMLSINSRLTEKKYTALTNTLSFCFPYLLIGGLVMCYNAMRFSSPFDFGASYNLTVSDMTLRGFSVDRWGLGVFEYLFRPPTITSSFPFLSPSVSQTAYIGYTSRENMYGGIFATHAILWALFGIYKIRKEKPFKFAVFLIAASLFTCLVDIQAGGIYPRYTSDFAIFFVMAAVIVLFFIYEEHPRFASKFVASALLCMIFYDILLIVGSGASSTADLRESLYSTVFSELVFFL